MELRLLLRHLMDRDAPTLVFWQNMTLCQGFHRKLAKQNVKSFIQEAQDMDVDITSWEPVHLVQHSVLKLIWKKQELREQYFFMVVPAKKVELPRLSWQETVYGKIWMQLLPGIRKM